MPGGVQAFTPFVNDVQSPMGGIGGIRELVFNRASTRAYALAYLPETDYQNLVVAFHVGNGTLQFLNSVRLLWYHTYANPACP